MADNNPLRFEHEHVQQLVVAIDEWEAAAREGFRKLGYSPNAVDRELALLFARRAAKYGIDLLSTHAVEKPTNGVNKL